jgi:hypothetical protein
MKAKLVLLMSIVTIIVTGLVLFWTNPSEAKGSFKLGQNMLNATPEEVGLFAKEHATNIYPSLDRVPPQVALVKKIIPDDITKLGLGFGEYYNPNVQYMLVILKGDFDLRNSLGTPRQATNWKWRVPYIAYIIDLERGAINTRLSSYGEKFRIALNDPNLPSDSVGVTPDTGPTSPPKSPILTGTPYWVNRPPYGTPAPTVKP